MSHGPSTLGQRALRRGCGAWRPSPRFLGTAASPTLDPWTSLSVGRTHAFPAAELRCHSQLPAGDLAWETQPSHCHSNEQHHPSGHRSSRKAPADLSFRMRRDPVRRTVYLSNRIESLRQGRSIGSHRGEAEGEVSETNRRRLPTSIGTPPLTVANAQTALRQARGGGRWG